MTEATCSCGSAWFVLRGNADEGMERGAFALDQRGLVTGYHGTPHCLDCGTPWTPTRERLRSVGGTP